MNPPENNDEQVIGYIRKYNSIIQAVESCEPNTLRAAYGSNEPYINPFELTQILRYHFKRIHHAKREPIT